MADERILIIDDEESLRHMLSSFLAKEGFAVAVAASGAAGLGSRRRDATTSCCATSCSLTSTA